MEKIKLFFKDRKNIAITILAALLLISISAYGSSNSSKETMAKDYEIKQEETIKQLESQVTTLKTENQSLKDANQNLENEKKALEEEKQSLSTQIEELKNVSKTATTNQNSRTTQNTTTTQSQNTPTKASTTTKTTTNNTSATTNNNTTVQNESSETVYVTRTGKKYHKSGCSYLKDSKIAKTLSEAKSQGYTACSKCY